jgi:molybdopterin molybdotransferase
MISFDQALDILRSVARPLGTETIALNDAAWRVLAAPVVAAIDSPRADVSAMDGYAVRGSDLEDFPVALKVVGESFPGSPWAGTVGRGSCVRIFTGAPLPAGADRIVIQEQVRRDGEVAIVAVPPTGNSWVRARGSDFRMGGEILGGGRLLDPAALVAAAGADLGGVEVFVQPRLALLVTGDELVAAGHAHRTANAVPDSVSHGLAALARQWGSAPISCARLPDDLEAMQQVAATAANSADLIVVTGGASVGERDFAKGMFEPQGLELLFSKIAIRPGKPAWLGRVGAKLVLGLPGNPTSALVTARLLLAPLLAAMQGRPVDVALRWEPARLGAPLPPCDARETLHRGRLNGGVASILQFQESHAQKALADADVLVRQQANSAAMPAGEVVQVLRL